MKKVLVGGLCASLIVGLSACNSYTTATKAPETSKTEAAVAVQKALTSGIDFANFDKSVRPQDDFYSYVNGTWVKNTTIP
ncbi:peptidase M13, partial [Shewanella sp. 10N.286.45.A1]